MPDETNKHYVSGVDIMCLCKKKSKYWFGAYVVVASAAAAAAAYFIYLLKLPQY